MSQKCHLNDTNLEINRGNSKVKIEEKIMNKSEKVTNSNLSWYHFVELVALILTNPVFACNKEM